MSLSFKQISYITLSTLRKKKSQILFCEEIYNSLFTSIEEISCDDSSRLPYDISNMFFIAACLANLSVSFLLQHSYLEMCVSLYCK